MYELKIKKNVMLISDLDISAEGKVPEKVVVIDFRKNYEVDAEGKRTDKVVSNTLECIDPVTYCGFNLKVLSTNLPFTKEDIEQASQPIMVEIPIKSTVIRPYEIAYGKCKVSIICPAVRILKGGDK